mmetsp:Transcript_17773/g.49274  ORF Transcript_17773/g.49274 Transcript_17773/m.49274 type:complete len:227 (-) Transcript_17773:134-814(-)
MQPRATYRSRGDPSSGSLAPGPVPWNPSSSDRPTSRSTSLVGSWRRDTRGEKPITSRSSSLCGERVRLFPAEPAGPFTQMAATRPLRAGRQYRRPDGTLAVFGRSQVRPPVDVPEALDRPTYMPPSQQTRQVPRDARDTEEGLVSSRSHNNRRGSDSSGGSGSSGNTGRGGGGLGQHPTLRLSPFDWSSAPRGGSSVRGSRSVSLGQGIPIAFDMPDVPFDDGYLG